MSTDASIPMSIAAGTCLAVSAYCVIEPHAVAFCMHSGVGELECVYAMTIVRVVMIVALLRALRRSGVDWRSLGCVRPMRVDVVGVLAVFATAISLQWACLRAHIDIGASMRDRFLRFDADTHYESAGLVLSVFVGPLLEELVFRSTVIAARTISLRLMASVVVSSALFAIAHMDAGIAVVRWAFAWGVVLSVVFMWRRSLWPIAVGHALWNLAAR